MPDSPLRGNFNFRRERSILAPFQGAIVVAAFIPRAALRFALGWGLAPFQGACAKEIRTPRPPRSSIWTPGPTYSRFGCGQTATGTALERSETSRPAGLPPGHYRIGKDGHGRTGTRTRMIIGTLSSVLALFLCPERARDPSPGRSAALPWVS